jgi:hypothetical protein
MTRLCERDLRAVLDVVAELHAVRTLDGFARHGNVALGRLVPCDLNGFVGKHLERIYAKLGVETRTAAARVALAP